MKILCKLLIYLYRVLISPILPKCCRFAPSCSEYAMEAMEKHNVVKAMLLILRRILKCHPLGSSGFDPVPDKIEYSELLKIRKYDRNKQF